jgi:hypothetical protein
LRHLRSFAGQILWNIGKTCSKGRGRTRCPEVSTRYRFCRVRRATRLRVLMQHHQPNSLFC